ncbi:MAG: 50S ribosomal protein L1 [Verrucomicrobia bacterium]|jgi:large subunit ribosomal protein L1|nr:50S ribosomal protein L1 [Verrucomicrobiota bacterium]
MPKHGKKYTAIKAQAPTEVLTIEAAVDFLKANPVAKFDETVELSMKMGLDSRKSENAVRGTCALPHGSGKAVRILVFAAGASADAAREAGADFVGNEDMIEKVKGGWTEFDVAIATPDAMKEVRKLGRVLGPRGLMPNPKTGTVTDDTAKAVNEAKAGRVEFRMDRHGNINTPAGKLSFESSHLVENINTIVEAVKAAKPAGARGTYIKNCGLTSTMGVGLRVNVRD